MDQKQFETWLSTVAEWHKPKPNDTAARVSRVQNETHAQTGPEIKRITYAQDQLCEWCKQKGTCQNYKKYTRVCDPKTFVTFWRWVCGTCNKIYNPQTQELGNQNGVGIYYRARGLRTAKPGNKLGRPPKPKWWNEGPPVVRNTESTAGTIINHSASDAQGRRAELLDRLEAMRTNK